MTQADASARALDERQRMAVRAPPGPLLVVAGAGSGKTRVLTERAAWLCRAAIVEPEAVLVITFTNRAAQELRERLARILGTDAAGRITVGTFHAACHRLVRRHARRVGRTPRFSIYDQQAVRRLAAEALAEEGIRDAREAKVVARQIGQAKARLLGPEEYAKLRDSQRTRRFARAYERYERQLAASDALDLDDLILRAVRLLDDPELLAAHRTRFRAILVDEYQDVNRAQYEWVRRLAAEHRNVTAVGDDDQAIYRFRAAEVRTLLDFERDFPGARVVALERNYRSSGAIVSAARSLAAHNRERREKRMQAVASPGLPVAVSAACDERAEARLAAGWCRALLARSVPANEIAVLFRTRAQAGALEDAMLELRVPHRLVGSQGLWEAASVRDLIAHLALIVNPRDRIALARALPGREGVGQRALERVIAAACERGGDVIEACAAAQAIPGLRGRRADAVREFALALRELDGRAVERGVAGTAIAAVEAFGLAEALRRERSEHAAGQLERLRRFCRAARAYEREAARPSLADFLAQAALTAERDEHSGPRVTLSTLHAAKGCEWGHVWIAGLCEGVLPHALSEPGAGTEDERRLCYVGLTRARRELALSWPRRRQGWPVRPSRFLAEAGLRSEARAADEAARSSRRAA